MRPSKLQNEITLMDVYYNVQYIHITFHLHEGTTETNEELFYLIYKRINYSEYIKIRVYRTIQCAVAIFVALLMYNPHNSD